MKEYMKTFAIGCLIGACVWFVVKVAFAGEVEAYTCEKVDVKIVWQASGHVKSTGTWVFEDLETMSKVLPEIVAQIGKPIISFEAKCFNYDVPGA